MELVGYAVSWLCSQLVMHSVGIQEIRRERADCIKLAKVHLLFSRLYRAIRFH